MTSLQPTAPSSADLNLRLLRHLVAYLREQFDAATLKAVASASRLTVDELLLGDRWISVDQFESILSETRALLPDDQSFKHACAYKIADVPGPVRCFCIGALSPVLAYELGAKNMRSFSAISQFHPEVLGHGRVRIGYTTTKTESRLMCLSRQAQIEQLPTVWKLPPAHVVETTCVARGDSACSYDVRVYEHRRWLRAAAGAAIAVAACFVWALLTGGSVPRLGWLACASLGLLAGHLYEHMRVSESNRHAHEEIKAAYSQMARDEANARRELFVLMQRQSTWGQLMESQVVGRAQLLQDVMGELETLQASRIIRLRGVTDGLDSPLEKVQANLQALRTLAKPLGAQMTPAIDQIEADVELVGRKLKELVRTAGAATDLVELMPQTLHTEPLVEELRTRLRALVHLPDVRASVFATREAPERIRTDIALFNRVVDNLLVNAAAQTERGSIVVEVSGTPGFLTIKVSDSGPGMEEERLARLFRPIQRTVVGNIAGAGLSVVVQLLALLGGRLEVMSAPGRGATFWAHIPIDSDAMRDVPPASEQTERKAQPDNVARVVTVRRWSQG